jgi:hypothetical protein
MSQPPTDASCSKPESHGRAFGQGKKRRVSSGGRRVTGEDKVAIFGRLVAGETSFVQRLVAGFAILEVGKWRETCRPAGAGADQNKYKTKRAKVYDR